MFIVSLLLYSCYFYLYLIMGLSWIAGQGAKMFTLNLPLRMKTFSKCINVNRSLVIKRICLSSFCSCSVIWTWNSDFSPKQSQVWSQHLQIKLIFQLFSPEGSSQWQIPFRCHACLWIIFRVWSHYQSYALQFQSPAVVGSEQHANTVHVRIYPSLFVFPVCAEGAPRN